MSEKEEKRKKLLAELSALDAEEKEAREEARLQENYEKWKTRKSVFMIGKAYLDIRNKSDLGISIYVPGNTGTTYKAGQGVPDAVATYYHNVIDDKLRRELQEELQKVVQNFVEKSVKSPQAVLEMMALSESGFYLKEFPKDKIPEVQKELREERFKILDQFTEEELVDVAVRHLSHGGNILRDYAQEKGYDLYASPVKNWLKDKK